jgi:hypothetical protein
MKGGKNDDKAIDSLEWFGKRNEILNIINIFVDKIFIYFLYFTYFALKLIKL